MAGEIVMTIVGNLTADPESRTVGNGSVASLTVAVTARSYDKDAASFVDGKTTFVRCSAWRELGDHVMGSLKKGMRVIAQGRFQQRDYEDREGQRRTAYELELDAIGPDLRYATAVVERAGQNRNQQARHEQGGYGAPSHQGQRSLAGNGGQQQPAQGGWGAGSYDDETPF